MYRTVNTVRLSHLWRLHVYIPRNRCGDAVWSQYPSQMPVRIFEDLLSMSNLQQDDFKHGVNLQKSGPHNRKPAYACGIYRYEGFDLLQRLWRQIRCQISLAGPQV